MKNGDIITLMQGGIMAATSHSLPVEHWYKWHKFRREVDKAWQEIGKEQGAILDECGIDRSEVGDVSKIDPEKVARWNALNGELLARDAEVKLPARIPLEFYKGLYDENQSDGHDIFANGAVEAIVIDNLFIEEENKDE